MMVKGKKVTELAAWSGDQEMLIHAAKPGVSEAVSIADIVAAGAGPGSGGGGGGYELGDIVLRPEGSYPGFVAVDGGEQLDPGEYPGLTDLVGVGTGFEESGSLTIGGFTAPDQLYVHDGVIYACDYDSYRVYDGSTLNVFSKGDSGQAIILKTDNGIYAFLYTYPDAQLCKLTSSGLVSTGYVTTSQDVQSGLNNYQLHMTSFGDRDLFINTSSNVSEYVMIWGDGPIVLEVEPGGLGSRYGAIMSLTSAGDRVFALCFDNNYHEDVIVELIIEDGTIDAAWFASASGGLGDIAAKGNFVFGISSMVRGDYYGEKPNEFSIHRIDGSANAIYKEQFLDVMADVGSLRIIGELALFTMQAGQSGYDGGMFYAVDLDTGEVSELQIPAPIFLDADGSELYVTVQHESGVVVAPNGDIIINRFSTVDIVKLPRIAPPAPGVKYYIKSK